MELNHQVANQLKQLRLSGGVETLEARQRQAIEGQWSYSEFLQRRLADEIERRAQKHLLGRIRRAKVNTPKTLEGFDFGFNPQLNRQQVLAIASGDYLRQHRNVLIYGPSGVGKSHRAQALGHEACRQGYEVIFSTTHALLQQLGGGRAEGRYQQRLEPYLRADLLILDDFGLRSLTPTNAADLYAVIAERYEQGSIIVTSNRAPSEWPDIFGNPLLASAGLDRLAHRAESIIITGRSFRATRGTGEAVG